MSKIKVIIPAAGYATRLYPLTKDTPKALLEVKGRPIVEHIIDRILELPVDGIFIVTNAKFYPKFCGWAEDFSCSVPLRVVNDGTTSNETRLGQIGDIMLVVKNEKINDDLLIIAGDNLFNFSLKPIFNLFNKVKSNVNGLYDVKSQETAKQLGIAVIDSKNRIAQFMEKPSRPLSTLASTGIYFMPKNNLKLLSKYLEQGNPADKMGHFMEWLIKNDKLYGFVYEEEWFDIGWHEALKYTRKNFKPFRPK